MSKQQKERKKLNVVCFHQHVGASQNFLFERQKESVWKEKFWFRKMKAAGFIFAWGCISSDATNLHKIYKSRKETFILLKGRESDQM